MQIKKLNHMLLSVLIAAALSLAVVGCKSRDRDSHADHSATSEHSQAEHPQAEHPQADHPHAEHPKSDHPTSEHPK